MFQLHLRCTILRTRRSRDIRADASTAPQACSNRDTQPMYQLHVKRTLIYTYILYMIYDILYICATQS